MSENTAKVDHQELAQLENRLRDHQGMYKVDSSGAISDRRSQMTHLKEPRLIQNFNQKARELEQMILEHTTSEKGVGQTNDLWDNNYGVMGTSETCPPH